MRTSHVPSLATLCLLAFVIGCGPSAPAATESTTPIEEATPAGETTSAPDGLTAALAPLPESIVHAQQTCDGGATDACNGLDDDCDGRIDEGCGYESGPIQITVTWPGGADVDLYVTAPDAHVLSYADPVSPSGGRLDHDARGACLPDGDAIENVFWPSDPPRGTYTVELEYYSRCDVAGPITARVSVSIGGHVIGVFAVPLEEHQRKPVLSFAI